MFALSERQAGRSCALKRRGSFTITFCAVSIGTQYHFSYSCMLRRFCAQSSWYGRTVPYRLTPDSGPEYPVLYLDLVYYLLYLCIVLFTGTGSSTWYACSLQAAASAAGGEAAGSSTTDARGPPGRPRAPLLVLRVQMEDEDVKIHAGASVSGDADIRGDVTILPGTVVHPKSVIVADVCSPFFLRRTVARVRFRVSAMCLTSARPACMCAYLRARGLALVLFACLRRWFSPGILSSSGAGTLSRSGRTSQARAFAG